MATCSFKNQERFKILLLLKKLAGPTHREWGSLNLYIGILGMKIPSFPTSRAS